MRHDFQYSKDEIVYLNKLAKKIKKLFITVKKRHNPEFICHPRFESCWFKAACKVFQLKADPILFVESQFLIPSETEILPNKIYGDSAVRRYKIVAAREKNPFELQIENQVFYLQGCAQSFTDKTLDEILADPKMPFKNFFRLMACSEEAVDDISKKYRKQAILELESNPGIKELIKQKYESRYKRFFPERVSDRINGEPIEDAGAPEEISKQRNYPRRRHR